jgi:hypothetical protein
MEKINNGDVIYHVIIMMKAIVLMILQMMAEQMVEQTVVMTYLDQVTIVLAQ